LANDYKHKIDFVLEFLDSFPFLGGVWKFFYRLRFKVFFTQKYIKIIFFIFKKLLLIAAYQKYLKIYKKIILSKKYLNFLKT
jgi:hypothetical protein